MNMQNQQSQRTDGLFDSTTNLSSLGEQNNCWGTYYTNGCPWHWTNYIHSTPPIELKLSEIGLLRVLVCDDPTARAILNKFSGHIKVEVEF